jgi:hypothetical protein
MTYSCIGYPVCSQLYQFMTLYVSVLLLSKEADSMQESANQISLEIKYYLFLEQKQKGQEIHRSFHA